MNGLACIISMLPVLLTCDVFEGVWWDTSDGWPLVKKANAHGDGVLDCPFGPQGELATCGRDGLLRAWSAEGNELKQFSIEADSPPDARPPAGVGLLPIRVAVSRDGSSLLAGSSAGWLHSWSTHWQ